eukprot:scaffold161220_cov18-Tisochrysis_lutea.AAC.2
MSIAMVEKGKPASVIAQAALRKTQQSALRLRATNADPAGVGQPSRPVQAWHWSEVAIMGQ